MDEQPRIAKIATHNPGRLAAVAKGLITLLEGSWPTPEATVVLAGISPESTDAFAAAQIVLALRKASARHPTASFWWKDAESVFLGGCERIGPNAGLPDTTALVGVPEGSNLLGWSRQSNLYRRDDREVLQSRAPKLDIFERQDRPGGEVVWLRTSKVPYFSPAGDGTVGGFDTLTDAEAQAIRRRLAETR